MPSGHIKTPKEVVCATCGTAFLGKHYLSRYCCYACMRKSNNRLPSRQYNKDAELMRLYGMTLDTFTKMFEDQEGKCKLCSTPAKKLFVDHCHTTSKVRGLLCMNCNTGLGHFKDLPNVLRLAADYIETHQETDVAELKRVKGI